MKKIVIISAAVIVLLLTSYIILLSGIRTKKSCHESAYWKAYDNNAKINPTVDQDLYNKHYTECIGRK